MEEKLTISVSELPELYNASLRAHRDLGTMELSWKQG